MLLLNEVETFQRDQLDILGISICVDFYKFINDFKSDDGLFFLSDKLFPIDISKLNFKLGDLNVDIDALVITPSELNSLKLELGNKVCFLMPIYPPHYQLAKQFLASFKKYSIDKQADVAFVFTNEEEQEFWGDDGDWQLILPLKLRIFLFNKAVVSIKKFWAWNELKDIYEYILVIDSETVIIKNINVYELCQNFFSSKILLGNLYPPNNTLECIKDSCKRFFKTENAQKILISDLYLWFNQPCIYKTDTLTSFFEITGMKYEIRFLTWYDFEYYIYMYYLILYQNFTIKNMNVVADVGACESFRILDYDSIENVRRLPVYMCTDKLYNFFNSKNIFMIIHLDRD